jgi:O-antigen biosynthesis protein
LEQPSAEHFWDREVVTPVHSSWMEHPLIREYIATTLSGTSQGIWPLDWLQTQLPGRRFHRALSIGCGAGALERDLIRRNLVDAVDAFDGSTNSLRVARNEAAAAGMTSRIRYYAADFNEPALPRKTYDLVLIHQALHHVAKLEKLYRAIMRTLTRDGLLYLDEYIGPSRTDWTEEAMQPVRAIFDALPQHVRREPRLNEPIMMDDPSEAIRSSEIMDQLRIGFDVRAQRGYGGNFLSVMYTSMSADRMGDEAMKALIEEERSHLAAGAGSYYGLILAEPKRGITGSLARARYFTEPKLKRIAREIKQRTR